HSIITCHIKYQLCRAITENIPSETHYSYNSSFQKRCFPAVHKSDAPKESAGRNMTKKNIATVLGLLLVLTCVALRLTRVVRGDEPGQLIGSWSLVSRQTTLADGKVVGDPGLSAVPKGILIYDRSGHVAAQ